MFLSVYGLHLSIFWGGFMASYLNIVFYNTSHLSLVPVLGSLGASLGTVTPVHGFRPFGGHHHVHDLGGGQPYIFLGGAFTQQLLTFVTSSVDFKHGSFTKGVVGHDLGFS